MGGVLQAFEDIPDGCVLGLNYSGMHDTALALVDGEGRLVRAVSLERISRVKQDGRWPQELLKSIPPSKIKCVAIGVAERYAPTVHDESRFLTEELTHPARFDRSHPPEFFSALSALDRPVVFVPHHLSHASSAFWGSGFDEALCLVYDGGMSNEHWFGGVWLGSRREGLSELDLFSAARYVNLAQLYATVTAALGFEPLRHEGKLTGLAAFGKPKASCLDLLRLWLAEPEHHYGLTYWRSPYGRAQTPKLCVDARVRERVRASLGDASAADVAASLQHLVEEQIVALVQRVLAAYPGVKKLCLSGGLFANVKINQRVAELGVEDLFVFPAMADDGVSVGAAWQASFERQKIPGVPIEHVFLGPNLTAERQGLEAEGVRFSEPANLAKLVAAKLAEGEVGAIVRGRSEFGPRALCNRSILASAKRKDVNDSLNERLRRTEFMPFAPVVREEDVDRYFKLPSCARKAAQFMTVTTGCLPAAIEQAPAVVHVDDTARPQLASRAQHGFIHEVLGEYDRLTGCGLLVNTSFNIHEEPIVAGVEDALRGFFEAGLDFLVLGDILVSRAENLAVEASFLRRKVQRSERDARALQHALDQKTLEAQELAGATEAYRTLKARIDRVDRSLSVRLVALLRGYQGV